MTDTQKERPFYTGMTLHPCEKGGFSLWVPSDWYKYDLQEGHVGMLFSPYPDDINTSLMAEKHQMKVKVKEDDAPILREGFLDGINALPGVEIESQSESISDTLTIFEARYTFLEGDARRKRWVKVVFWGRAQLLLVAQGRTIEDFEYWLPMFYNTMMTVKTM